MTLDGAPLGDAEVVFLKQSAASPASPPSATTDAKGEFRLQRGSDGEGEMVGKYKVIIRAGQSGKPLSEEVEPGLSELPRAATASKIEATDLQRATEVAAPGAETDAPQLPRAYADEQTTPFVVEIRPGVNEFRIELDSRFSGPGLGR